MRILLGMACSKCQMCQDCQKGRRKGRKGQKKGPRKGRTTQQNIDSSGREIYEKGGQITVLTDKRCDVKSQTVEGKTYRVSYGLDKFTCVTHTRGGVQVQAHGGGPVHAALGDQVALQGGEDHRRGGTKVSRL